MAILFAAAVIVAVTWPRLPSGMCYGDSGEFQLASVTLGIAHPPGYGLLASVGWLVTLVPGIEPAYAVSLFCMACGVGAIVLGMLLMVRLGLSAPVAAMIGVLTTAHPRVWSNLITPEVYAPGLVMLAGASYLLVGYAHHGRFRNVLWGGLLFGAAIATRPPTIVAAPFFIAAFLITNRRTDVSTRRRRESLVLIVLAVMAPLVYQGAYLWMRDRPQAMYNYIKVYNDEANDLPPSSDGVSAKLRRLKWTVSGEQFRDMMGVNWVWFKRQFGLLNGELTLDWLDVRMPTVSVFRCVAVWSVIAFGFGVLFRRNLAASLVLLGVAVQCAVFVSNYRVSGGAADLLPLLWTAVTLTGVALSPLLRRSNDRVRAVIGTGLLLICCGWMILDAPNREPVADKHDGEAYLAGVDLASFPDGAVIFSTWPTSPPLWYARAVSTGRYDIRIVNAKAFNWLRMIKPYLDRPVFFTKPLIPLPQGYRLTPFRSMWRLEPE